MKRLKKGFTLIELLVVIAIIGILATTLAPKLREQLAKAKDAKAVAVLGAARTGGSVAVIDAMVTSTDGSISLKFSDILAKLDDATNEMFVDSTGYISVGGTATTTGTITYGGTVGIINTNSTSSTSILTSASSITLTSDDLDLSLKSNGQNYSTEGKLWSAY